jgi:hypothetical protein
MIYRFVLPLACLWTLAFIVPAQGAIVTLTPAADVRVLDYYPDTNHDSESLLSVYTQPFNVQRTLIQFDLGSLPLGQQIDSAVLTLHPSQNFGDNASGLDMNVHALTKPWIENRATWNSASTGNLWATPGGDFDPLVYAVSTNQFQSSPVNWDVTSLIQDWYDGTVDNFGLLIRSFPGNSMHFYSKESSTLALRPTLTVTYSVPEVRSIILLGVGLVSLFAVAGCRRAMRSF